MAEYKFEMVVTEAHVQHYTVEADNLEDARYKAQTGDTIDEDNICFDGVINREIVRQIGEEPSR